MRLTIIPSDKTVAIDGIAYIGLSFEIDSNIHAVQWQSTKGEIEFVPDSNGIKPPNMEIDSVDQFQSAIDAWNSQHQIFTNPPPPTEQQLKDGCLVEAKRRLQVTDYAMLPDVFISNKSEFETYRAIVRGYVINPVSNPVFPVEPQPIWINS